MDETYKLIKSIDLFVEAFDKSEEIGWLFNMANDADPDIFKELENYTTFVSADTLASVEYDKTNLMSDATVKINLFLKSIYIILLKVDYSY